MKLIETKQGMSEQSRIIYSLCSPQRGKGVTYECIISGRQSG